jgi:hypothetical protein
MSLTCVLITTAQNECGDTWDVLGWINPDPGHTQIRANATGNKWFYYYAEDVNGTVWSGPYVAEVTQDRFEKCTCLSHNKKRSTHGSIL